MRWSPRRARLVLFLDDDVIFDSACIEMLLAVLTTADPSVAIAVGCYEDVTSGKASLGLTDKTYCFTHRFRCAPEVSWPSPPQPRPEAGAASGGGGDSDSEAMAEKRVHETAWRKISSSHALR